MFEQAHPGLFALEKAHTAGPRGQRSQLVPVRTQLTPPPPKDQRAGGRAHLASLQNGLSMKGRARPPSSLSRWRTSLRWVTSRPDTRVRHPRPHGASPCATALRRIVQRYVRPAWVALSLAASHSRYCTLPCSQPCICFSRTCLSGPRSCASSACVADNRRHPRAGTAVAHVVKDTVNQHRVQ